MINENNLNNNPPLLVKLNGRTVELHCLRILYALTHEGPQTMKDINHVVLKRSFTASEIQDAFTELGSTIVATQLRTKGAKRPTTIISLRQQ